MGLGGIILAKNIKNVWVKNTIYNQTTNVLEFVIIF